VILQFNVILQMMTSLLTGPRDRKLEIRLPYYSVSTTGCDP